MSQPRRNLLPVSLTLLLAALFALCPGAAFAQQAATATIEGVATDPQGAVVPNVKVTVVSNDTGLTREAMTDENGIYRLPLLPPGRYKLTAKSNGFADVNFNSVTLTVGQKLNLDLQLSVTVGETVTITDAAPVVETSRSSVSGSVNSRAVAELPVNGRNFLDFVTLTPGVVRDPRQGDLSFGGQKGTLNSIQIDGVDNNNTFFGQALGRTGSGRAPYQFSQDAVQEFQVNTNSFSAEFGRAAGGAINVITKSGTNDFHGSAFEFYRDRSLNASSLVTDPTRNNALVKNFERTRDANGNTVTKEVKAPYHFNQFGGTFGGPIKKDRAFFFFNYDGQRNTQPNTVTFGATAPADAASQSGLTKLLPYATSYTRGFNQDVYLGKVDWQISAENRLGVRYNRQNFTGVNLENSGPTSAQEHSGNSLVTTDTFTVTLNTTFTPRLLNEFRVQVGRDREPGFANSDNPEAVIRQNGVTVISIGRNNFSPRETTERKYQFIDNITWIAGRHNVKGGVDFNVEKIKNFFPGFFGAGYNYNSYADFFNNKPASFTQAFAGDGTTGATTYPNFNEYGVFVQDDWRATNRLTLNFGLRYDAQIMAQGNTTNGASTLLAAGIDTARIHNDLNNFAPRFGFAWKPTDSDRFVVRGGYGLFYGRTPSIALGTAHSNNGVNIVSITLNNPNLVYPFRFPSLSAIQAAGGAAPASALFIFEKNYQQPYTEQGSLGFELGLTNDLSFGASYLSVRGRHLQRTRDINLLPTVTYSTTAGSAVAATFQRHPGPQGSPTRPIAGFTRIREFESSANSNYNALVLQLNKRFSHHFQTLASYTWSKVIDDAPDATSVVDGNASDEAKQAQNSLNLRDDRGVGNADVPHRFVASGVWDLDYFNGAPRAARLLVGGWQLSGIFQAASNQPFSVVAGADLNNDSNRNSDRAPGFGRNTFRKGKFVSLDVRARKTFAIRERYRLELIGELFNAFNRINYSRFQNQIYNVAIGSGATPTVTLTPRADYGDPRGAFDPRIGQLALKLTF